MLAAWSCAVIVVLFDGAPALSACVLPGRHLRVCMKVLVMVLFPVLCPAVFERL